MTERFALATLEFINRSSISLLTSSVSENVNRRYTCCEHSNFFTRLVEPLIKSSIVWSVDLDSWADFVKPLSAIKVLQKILMRVAQFQLWLFYLY